MDIIRGKQRQFDDDTAIAVTAHFANASSAINSALSMISLQSLITLLRNPQVRAPKSQPRVWLAEVAAQYAVPKCELLVETLGRRCYNW